MNPSQRIVFNTGVLYAKMVITLVVSLFATRITLKALGASDLGIYYLVAGIISMLSFMNTAMAISTQRFLSYYIGKNELDKLKKIFNSSVVLHFILGICLVVIFEVVGLLLFDGLLKISVERLDAAKWIFHFMVFSSFMTVLSVPYNAAINSHEDMFLFSIIGIVESIGKLLIALVIIRSTYDKLILYGLLLSLLSFFIFFSKRLICKIKYEECKGKVVVDKDKRFIKEMFSFTSWNLYGIMAGAFRGQGINIILNYFFGTVVNAAYGIANQVNGQLSYFSTALVTAFNPQIMKSEGSGERNRMITLSKLTSKYSFLILSFFCIPLIIEMDYVIHLWLKDVPEYTVIFCKLVLVLTLINQLTVGLQSSAQAVGRIKVYQFVIGSINLSAPILGFIFLKYGNWNPQFVIIVTILVEIVAGIWRIIFLNKLAGLSIKNYIQDVLLPTLIVFLIVYFTTLYINRLFITHNFMGLVITIFISSVLLAIGVYFFALGASEKAKLLSQINKIKKK